MYKNGIKLFPLFVLATLSKQTKTATTARLTAALLLAAVLTFLVCGIESSVLFLAADRLI